MQTQATAGSLEYWADARPDAQAVIEGERSLTWREWNARADRLAAAFAARGLAAGDIVVVRTQIRLEWSVIAAALGKLGCRLLGMNWRLTPAEVRYVLNNSEAVAVICDDPSPTALIPAFDGRPLKAAVSIDVPAEGFEDYAALLAEEHGATFLSAGDPPLVIYTSGTTGLPKGVVMERGTDRTTQEYLLDVQGHRDAGPDDAFLVTMPMHHGSGPAQMWRARRAGSKAVILRRFDPQATLDAIERHRITHWTGVPTMFKRLAALPPGEVARRDLSSLRNLGVGAAPVSDDLKAWIIENLGDCLGEGYGSTETGMISYMPPEMQKAKPGSSGLPNRHVRIEIRDEDGRRLPTGEVGEIWVWTPVSITRYLNQPPLGTDVRDAQGFFRTGDMGRLDEDGYLFISDRAKDMIISGGVNIYPAEIEAVLNKHPAVVDSAVIGIPDEEFGESVMAFCEIKPGSTADEAGLLAHCTELLASYKRPRTIRIVNELPRNTVGKLLKRDLRAPFWKDKEKKV
ncbi:MAG: AMP-binding protein [Burkholderiaceae bacterium]|nr:AMP-binding protein [Burkholderiaceae bacterium]